MEATSGEAGIAQDRANRRVRKRDAVLERILASGGVGDAISDALSGIGLLVGAVFGGIVAVMGAADRMANRRDAKLRLYSKRVDNLQEQVEWHHRREHDLLVALQKEGVEPPPVHAEYPAELEEDRTSA